MLKHYCKEFKYRHSFVVKQQHFLKPGGMRVFLPRTLLASGSPSYQLGGAFIFVLGYAVNSLQAISAAEQKAASWCSTQLYSR